MAPIAKPAFERFEEKVYRQETGCWLWLGTKARGYGRFRPGGTQGKVPAHRFAYEHYVGPIPDGFVCDHLCRNRACVNPGHIELVTSRDNVLRGVEALQHEQPK